MGGVVAQAGAAVVNDAKGKAQHEVDVVARGSAGDGSRPVIALGEAKHTTRKRTVGDLARLDRIRMVVAEKEPSAAAARLLVFSASGFDARLTAAVASRSDVELDRLHRGD